MATTETITGTDGNDTMGADQSNYTLIGGPGDDVLLGWGPYYVRSTSSQEVLRGGTGDDYLSGSSGTDALYGGGDNDTLAGGTGADTLDGGRGDDILSGGQGADTLTGGAGADIFHIDEHDVITDYVEGEDTIVLELPALHRTGTEGNDSFRKWPGFLWAFQGLDGADTAVDAGFWFRPFEGYVSGVDTLDGGGGDDFLISGERSSLILGGSGNDKLLGFSGADSLSGGADNDLIEGHGRNDILDGGSGQDTLIGGEGADTLTGGEGADIFYVDAHDTVTDFVDGVDIVFSSPPVMVIDATQGDDRSSPPTGYVLDAYGSAASNLFSGGDAGADTLRGADGHDDLKGGAGNDSLDGGEDNDRLSGNPGNDTLAGRDGQDSLYGGDGEDDIRGGREEDLLCGSGGHDMLTGGGGDDTLFGGAGTDTLVGGTGSDTFYVDGEDVLVDYVEGEDVIVHVDANLVVRIDGQQGDDQLGDGRFPFHAYDIRGHGGDDYINGSLAGNNTLRGNAGDDGLYGYDGDEFLNGGIGADNAFGGEGNDWLRGGLGHDSMDGNSGADTLSGGAGNDTLNGGLGNDVFCFDAAISSAANRDIIEDFHAGEDRIELDADVFTTLQAGTLSADAFHAGSAAADQSDRIIYDEDSGSLYYDADGSGAGALVKVALLDNHAAISAADFIIT